MSLIWIIAYDIIIFFASTFMFYMNKFVCRNVL
jgi:hypothetical protein